ncbi:hypothetical protein [Methylotuvimicrobium sp. KM2]|uniref:hypothetical protein n=1 Tax=Methylotuvimicrobium sp. KM2 TaxID=3133976 RepID=UPI003100E267
MEIIYERVENEDVLNYLQLKYKIVIGGFLQPYAFLTFFDWFGFIVLFDTPYL